MLLKIVDFPKKELRNDKSFYALSNIKKLNKFQPKKKIYLCYTLSTIFLTITSIFLLKLSMLYILLIQI